MAKMIDAQENISEESGCRDSPGGPVDRIHLAIQRMQVLGYTQASLGFPGAQMAESPPAVQGTWVGSLGWEDPLEEGMATRSSILAWRI